MLSHAQLKILVHFVSHCSQKWSAEHHCRSQIHSSNSVIYTSRGSWNILSDLMDIGGTHKVTTNPVTSASVFRHFSFHKFHKLLKLGHLKNLKKTSEHLSLGTYIPFHGNLTAESHIVNPSPDLPLQNVVIFLENALSRFPQVSRNQQNQQNCTNQELCCCSADEPMATFTCTEIWILPCVL